jgi:ribosomal protein S21|tara:strand:- start:7623 stop:7811 length:189 start_codon:yes stop_codon:yes gene_type:complete
MKVTVRGTNVEGALRLFKRKTMDSGILNTVREKEFFEKKSAKRQRKMAAARMRERKRQETKS